MTRLNVGYQGFKMGFLVGDQMAVRVAPTLTPKAAEKALHALKTIVAVEDSLRYYQVFGINGSTVTAL